MEKKKLSNEQMSSLVISIVIFAIGVLFCCSPAMGINGVSILIGVSMIVTGLAYIVSSVISTKNLLNINGVVGSAVIAFGVMFAIRKMAGLIFDFIPFLLTVFGLCILIDAFLKRFVRKENQISGFVVELIIGAITLALGLCLKFIPAFSNYASLVLGIILVVYSVITVCNLFFNKKGEKKSGDIETK